jgi:putative FmdB family regulatory protein
MPTYDYICTACNHAWELEQRIVEDPVRKCPKCRANKAKRQISSGAGFILKGGGWYADGYGSKKSSSSESSSDDKSSSTESKSDTKAEGTSPSTESKKGEGKKEPSDAKTADAKGEKKSPKKPDSKASAA